MAKAVVNQAQGDEDRFRAGPWALFSWFQSVRKGLGSFNRFEQLNKVVADSLFRGHSRSTFFRDVTVSIFNQRDGEKDDVTIVKETKYCCLKGGKDGVVSTASTATSNPPAYFVLLRHLWFE